MWFGGNPAGPCPAGGTHIKTDKLARREAKVIFPEPRSVKNTNSYQYRSENKRNRPKQIFLTARVKNQSLTNGTKNISLITCR
jgi:hypothetical protein